METTLEKLEMENKEEEVKPQDTNDSSDKEETLPKKEEEAILDQTAADPSEENSVPLYDLLSEISNDKLVIYTDAFECPVCFCEYKEMEGIILKECLHVFCRDCLISLIEHNDAVDVGCPFKNEEYSCPSYILESEIQSLLSPDAYSKRLARTLAVAEAKMQNAYHCKTPDCAGWCIKDVESSIFSCPVCSAANCLLCKTIHTGLSCEEYKDSKNGDLTSKLSERALKDLVLAGEAMYCSKCKAVLVKTHGCDAITCSFCNTQACWATKGPRWGPGGSGDISGGCKCKVNGRRCHPKCGDCH